jgi:hypothetical protein
VWASPGGGIFPFPSTTVTLAASDDSDPNPTIYYTMDLSEPTTSSPVYTGPINVSSDTILKFFARDSGGNESAHVTEGYIFAGGGLSMEWAASAHADMTGEAFRHWDEDGHVEAETGGNDCARCHTGWGFNDHAEDGILDTNPAALPLYLGCTTCHGALGTLWDDPGTYTWLEPVRFPSTAEASLFGPSNMCATCHQGRESTDDVDAEILAGPGPYSFLNIHYYAAGATLFGNEARGGYQYAGKEYIDRNTFPSHPEEFSTCVGCHMPKDPGTGIRSHTFLPKIELCQDCHSGSTFETLSGSPGVNYTQIHTLTDDLYAAIQAYASSVVGQPVVYSSPNYPYWFNDSNGNGAVDPGENIYPNRYQSFNATLLRAAYNYQVSLKDPNNFIHSGSYTRQILFDSIMDLGGSTSATAPGRAGWTPSAGTAGKSEQFHLSGHAHASAGAFRHWDEDGYVEFDCARCHSTPGHVDYVADGVVVDDAPLGTVVECFACHAQYDLFSSTATRHADILNNPALEPVAFPSGATATLGNSSNICAACHQGRESGLSVDAATPNTTVQSPVDYDSFSFISRHYYAAAAIYFGTEVTAAYEYAGQTYLGKHGFGSHPLGLRDCRGCHLRGVADHTFEVQIGDCIGCHTGITDFEDVGKPFGIPNTDYDGDGVGGSFQDEIDGMRALLYAAMQSYARFGLPNYSPLIYAGNYPYWFHDTNDNGLVDPGENVGFGPSANAYGDFDRTLLAAAYNYKAADDPCSDIHNYRYTLQTLYDSADWLDDGVLNGSVTGTSGPALRP